MRGNTLLILYNLLQLMAAPILAPPLLLYGLARKKYRGHLAGRLALTRLARGKEVGPGRRGAPRIWLHALSLGEVNSALPLIRALARRWPSGTLFLSASTATGLERLREEAPPGAVVFPAPLDLWPSAARRVRDVSPHLFLLVETDVWPNLLHLLHGRGVPSILVNGAISPGAARRMRSLPGLSRLLYSPFTAVVMQSQEDRDRIEPLIPPRVRLEPPCNLKYDKLRELPHVSPKLFGLPPDPGPILVAGSTHPGEEEELMRGLAPVLKARPHSRLILAPRDPARGAEVAGLIRGMGFPVTLRSRWRRGEPVEGVLVLDTLGELTACYGLAHTAFVGGSLVPVGGHDLLEPAAWSIPVLFGPHLDSCEAVARQLEEAGGGARVGGGDELARRWEALMDDHQLHRRMGSAARRVVDAHAGAVDRYIALAEELLGEMAP